MTAGEARPLRVFVVAGEESGDALAAPLMLALAARKGGARFVGVGGDRMRAAGLESLFPMEDLTAMGFAAVIGKLPTILRRMRQTVEAIIADPPDVVVLVDSPDFTHRVAARLRARRPDIPIVKYVAPTVWAWRSGRARALAPIVDHVLALLPFEPKVMAELGGPPTRYVGHSLSEERAELRPSAEEAERRRASPPLLLVLPGSRGQEIRMMAPLFGKALAILVDRGHRFELVLPTPPRLKGRIEALTADWSVTPRIVTDPAAKRAAFRSAYAALAASGTVTLELALARIPMVGAYRLPNWEAIIAWFALKTRTILLANIVLGRQVIPEVMQLDCTPERLADALEPILREGPAREAQFAAFDEIERVLDTGGRTSAEIAAEVVEAAAAGRNRPAGLS
ncbi:MAG: lipid-A-disaccharide synthase [Rhizobiales bacterium]|nr:lipid-A-disaccharide synthase [Hyphomicrobiales bacterium]